MDDKAKASLWRTLFHGRQDVYGMRKTYFDNNAGKLVSRYHPVTTGSGDNATNVPLTDDAVLQHIRGQAELLIYLMQLDSSVYFGAVDYDEDHKFVDTLRSKQVFAAAGIKSHIARSTRKGYHLYVFITEKIPVAYLISLYDHLFERAGFQEDMQYARRLLPETFPRRVSTPALGHGIKPPLWGAGLPDHNCWVDDEDIAIEDQWAHTQWIHDEGRNDAQTLMKLIEDHPEMEFLSDGVEVSKNEMRANREKPEYKAPQHGDFNKALQKCECLKKMWATEDKMLDHDKRVALLAFAKATTNGLDVVRLRFGNSPEAERQIKYALDTNQMPWTCQALKTRLYCDKTDWCLEKRPPMERIDGKVVTNPQNLPKTQWADPSPIRYAYESQILDAGSLKGEIIRLKEYTGIDREELIASMCKNILLLDTAKKIMLEDDLIEHKIFKNRAAMKRQLQALEVEINREKNKKLPLKFHAGFEIGEGPAGYIIYNEGKKGEKIPTAFTNYKVYITQDVCIEGVFETTRNYSGELHVFRDSEDKPTKHKFTIGTKEFYDNRLVQVLGGIAGATLLIHTGSKDVDALRACIITFGTTLMVNTKRYEEYGMRINATTGRPDKYMAGGDMVVTAQGVMKEPECCIDLSSHEIARGLGLKDISTSALREVLQHFVNDVMTCHEPVVIYTTIAHSLQATIHETMIPLPDKPTLWVQGLTGSGKSFVGDVAAALHGDAKIIQLNASTTPKSMESYGAVFKDALLLIDDYKAGANDAGMKRFIQNVYDSKARGRLKQSGRQNNAPRVRALCMVTAEDVLACEASVIARQILIRTGAVVHDSDEARLREKAIKKNQHLYPAITANFIRFMLNQTVEAVHAAYEPLRQSLLESIRNTQNSNRLCNNLAANLLTFTYFLDFLVSYNIITLDQKEMYRCMHQLNVRSIIMQMTDQCAHEQASSVFIDTMSEILSTGEFFIEGATQGLNSAKCLGYANREFTGGPIKTVFLLPGVCVEAVKRHKNVFGDGLSHTMDSIGQQLKQMDVLMDTYEGRTTVRRVICGRSQWVWICSPEKLGFNTPQPIPDRTTEEELARVL